ncbi:hypothetical protein ACFLY9_00345 [Patescibacteria group bacterium]
MSKSLVKLVDAALVPAAIMILGKVIGLWFVNIAFKLDWSIITDSNNFFSVKIEYATLSEQITATSYSNLIMYLFVFAGFLFVLIRALYLHSSHITPSMIAKLATNNLLNLITDSFEIYHKASVWLIMLWLALIALTVNVLLGRAYPWTGVISVLCTVLATVILLRDVAKEVEIAKKNLPKLSENNLSSNTK